MPTRHHCQAPPCGVGAPPVRYSSKERAVLELLDELPEHESFHQVDAMMESERSQPSPLANPRSLLQHKGEWLFLFFADRHRLRGDRNSTGQDRSGFRKRVLVGQLDPQYDITVPADLEGNRKWPSSTPIAAGCPPDPHIRSWRKSIASRSRAARRSTSSCATRTWWTST